MLLAQKEMLVLPGSEELSVHDRLPVDLLYSRLRFQYGH